MSHDSDLDTLIQRARSAEAPGPLARDQVRRRLARQLARGASDPASEDFERAVLEAPPRTLPRLVNWGVPLAAIGAAAWIALRLAPQTADPLVHTPPPPPVVGAPTAPGIAASPASSPLEPTPVVVSPPTEPATASEAPAAPSPARPAARASAPPAVPSSDLLAESRALARVQQALRDGQPALALRLLSQQERDFARGALHEERAAARAMALCSAGQPGAGQHEAGRRAAAAFAARYPQSVLAGRVQSSCAAAEKVNE